MQRSKKDSLFDHLVGAGEQRGGILPFIRAASLVVKTEVFLMGRETLRFQRAAAVEQRATYSRI
jgi:hypothetical protein